MSTSATIDRRLRNTALLVAAYLVTLAVLIPLGGWLAARWGARPVFLAAIAIFTVASLGCAVSTAFAELVVAAVPFLLTLVFQNVFGWSPVKSGALVLFVFVGNIAIKPATTPLLRRFGFRPVLVGATAGAAAAPVVLVATAAALRLHPDAGSAVSRRASPSPESA